MANNILHLRGLTSAGTADYTLGTATYWDDDQVQTVLDNNRIDIYREQLGKVQEYEGGTVVYKKYESKYAFLESGSDVFEVEDSVGNTVGTALYSVDYQRGKVTFASDTGGSIYYMTARSYFMGKAAANIWRMKAANVTAYFDFSTDNHKINRSQVTRQFLDMADYYDKQSGVITVEMYRSDDVF
jgi:hypothetical protein